MIVLAPKAAPLLRVQRGERRLVCLPGLPPELQERWLGGSAFEGSEPVSLAGEREDLALLQSDLGQLVAKRMTHRGLRRIRARFRPGRAQRAFELGRLMRARGVSTPEPIAWLRESADSDILFVRFVDGRHLLDSAVPELWEALARAVARLHCAGFRHRDLKAPNIVVTGSKESPIPWLLDLDGARRAPAPPSRRIVVRDAGRIAASLLSESASQRGLGEDEVRHFCSILQHRIGLPKTDRTFADDILTWAKAKLLRNARLGRMLT
ncbi:MAG: hypothetical protein ACI8QS_001209 [Planctomycetota bacterium]